MQGKEKSIIFYGKNHTPLSHACYGCHFYNELCPGSVYANGDCGTGAVEDTKPSMIANQMLEETGDNPFLLARVLGYDLTLVEKQKLDVEVFAKYEKAIETAEDVIQSYIKKYDWETHGLVNIES